VVINKIKEFRKEKGVTQLEMARDLKITRQTVIAIEKGKYNPSIELSLKIAHYFGVSVEDIFKLEGVN